MGIRKFIAWIFGGVEMPPDPEMGAIPGVEVPAGHGGPAPEVDRESLGSFGDEENLEAGPGTLPGHPPPVTIGPFSLPAPDDPRWSAIVDDVDIVYVLDEVRTLVLRGGYMGIVMVASRSLRLLEGWSDSFDREVDRYALAVREAYNKAHPGSGPDLSYMKAEVMAHLSRINGQ